MLIWLVLVFFKVRNFSRVRCHQNTVHLTYTILLVSKTYFNWVVGTALYIEYSIIKWIDSTSPLKYLICFDAKELANNFGFDFELSIYKYTWIKATLRYDVEIEGNQCANKQRERERGGGWPVKTITVEAIRPSWARTAKIHAFAHGIQARIQKFFKGGIEEENFWYTYQLRNCIQRIKRTTVSSRKLFLLWANLCLEKKITHTRELLNHHCSIVSSDYATKRQKRKDHTQTIIHDNLKTKFETHFCLCKLYKKQTCGLE